MSRFLTAKELFERAQEMTDSERNPALWNMLSGLVRLSEQVQRIENDARTLERKLDSLAADVRRLKSR